MAFWIYMTPNIIQSIMFLFYIHELKECLFKLLFNEKFASQILHLNNWVLPSVTERICLFNELLKYVFKSFPFLNNFGCLSKLHVQGFLLSWTLPMCFFRLLFLGKTVVTDITFEWFVRIVDRSSVFWQIALLRKTSVTNVTFEWFLSLFMFFENMFFQSLLLRAVKEQIYCFLNKKFTQIWYKKLSLPKIISLHDPGWVIH